MQQLSLFDQPVRQPSEEKVVVTVQTDTLTKVYYTITEVADMFHVNASLLRFWEKEFPTQLGGVKKNKKGDRYYNKKDLEWLRIIYFLVKEKKMTLEGTREYLKNNKRKAKDDIDIIDKLGKIKAFLLQMKKSLQ